MRKDLELAQLTKALENMGKGKQDEQKDAVSLYEKEPYSADLFSRAIEKIRQKDAPGARALLSEFRHHLEGLKPKDILHFGHYMLPSWIDPNPDRIRAPISWSLLARSGSRLLLLSTHCLAYCLPWGEQWTDSDARRDLNKKYFSEWFTPQEQEFIIPTHHITGVSAYFPYKPAEITLDQVFFLDLTEVIRFFSALEPEDIKAQLRNDRILDLGADVIGGSIMHGAIDTDNDNKVVVEEKHCSWWLRTMGSERGTLILIQGDRYIDLDGESAYSNDESGMRPAIWIDINNIDNLLHEKIK